MTISVDGSGPSRGETHRCAHGRERDAGHHHQATVSAHRPSVPDRLVETIHRAMANAVAISARCAIAI